MSKGDIHMNENTIPFEMTRIRQRLECSHLADVLSTLQEELGTFKGLIGHGDRIALAVGSRGIANLPGVVAATVEFVRSKGGAPFIVPAMGSHGGATGAGQAAVLAGYGITEGSVGAPVRSSMETVEIERGACQLRLFMDRAAWESDGVILINRVKPHTDFHGRYESGLVKMCVVGLGNEEAARQIHLGGVRGLRDMLGDAGGGILASGKIIGGVALVENALEETMIVRALKASDILREEPALLEMARANMPRLPADEMDVLIIDRMGKEISGVGMDPNVIGRYRVSAQEDPVCPRVEAIMVCDLTDASHGNALGVGLADVTTRRLYDKIDLTETYTNAFASTFLERAKIPVAAATDRDAFTFALRAAHCDSTGGARVMRIKDTLHTREVYVSASLLTGQCRRADVEVISAPSALFDESGTLRPF